LKLCWNLEAIDRIYSRTWRAAPQGLLHLVEHVVRTLRNYFNCSVGQITRESPQL
jgi:hypothetical protein